MSEASSPIWAIRPTLRLDRRQPYLLLQHITLFVADQERSLCFFRDGLGFQVVLDYRAPDNQPEWRVGQRWISVAPPDGTARLALVTPSPDSEEFPYIGKARQVVFLTENVEAKYQEWSMRGVRFAHPPRMAPFGSLLTRFEDPDGNSFALIEFDEATRLVEEQRRRTEEQQEMERRAARELEIARQVQSRLFPQRAPAAATLQYAGTCVQARQVGGDYYDYLDLGRGRLGLVIGDIAGKGMAAALLMANLQANLRSQSATAALQPEHFLQSVNQLFYENTADGDYATLFFAEYEDEKRRLRYANCGHLPALLLRKDGRLERLEATATVLGLFESWECAIEERELSPGDTLLLYTDGATESFNAAGDQFGEERLVAALQRRRNFPPEELAKSIIDEVHRFNPKEQQDDITLIAAHCR
jgi:serine phosphatase RsbU (regulator of sigma subunit)/predicted enzyme related to lactoylglutathione lyase